MGPQYWIWMAVTLILSSSVLTTAKFNPHVPHLLDAGKVPASSAHLSLLFAEVDIAGISPRSARVVWAITDVIVRSNSEEFINDFLFVNLFV